MPRILILPLHTITSLYQKLKNKLHINFHVNLDYKITFLIMPLKLCLQIYHFWIHHILLWSKLDFGIDLIFFFFNSFILNLILHFNFQALIIVQFMQTQIRILDLLFFFFFSFYAPILDLLILFENNN
jgi:hypothetical protein